MSLTTTKCGLGDLSSRTDGTGVGVEGGCEGSLSVSAMSSTTTIGLGDFSYWTNCGRGGRGGDTNPSFSITTSELDDSSFPSAGREGSRISAEVEMLARWFLLGCFGSGMRVDKYFLGRDEAGE